MRDFSLLLYHLVLSFYHLGIRLAAFWNPKAAAWVKGRKGWRQALQQSVAHLHRPVWIHCASLGEFEQGRPLIEQLKAEHPEVPIVLTFYSPSGFEVRHRYAHADVVAYLPADTPANARDFLNLLQPRLAMFVKYEFWLNYIFELQRQAIPLFLIAGSFRNNQVFFQPYGGIFRKALQTFAHLFVQNEQDKVLLSQIDVQNVAVVGDPRIDRVGQIANAPKAFPIIQSFAASHPTVIFGSSWEQEHEILIQYVQTNSQTSYRFIIAPHDIADASIQALKNKLPLPHQTYSAAQKNGLNPETTILIIDNIGMLSSIYQYGKIAFVGGGFGEGIHNILEPAAHGLPVLFGGNHRKFPEAKALIELGGGFQIESVNDFTSVLEQSLNPVFSTPISKINKGFVEKNSGATVRIFAFVKSILCQDF